MNVNERNILDLIRQGEGIATVFKTCQNRIGRDVYWEAASKETGELGAWDKNHDRVHDGVQDGVHAAHLNQTGLHNKNNR